MRYKITVTEETQEEKADGGNWEEGADTDSSYSKKYGYTPAIKKIVDVTREIYTQNTDTLDLKAVIIAINGL